MPASMKDQYYGSTDKLLDQLRQKIPRLACRLRIRSSTFLTDILISVLQEIIGAHQHSHLFFALGIRNDPPNSVPSKTTFPHGHMFCALPYSLGYFTLLSALVKCLFLAVNQLQLSGLICSPRYLHESSVNMPRDSGYKHHCPQREFYPSLARVG